MEYGYTKNLDRSYDLILNKTYLLGQHSGLVFVLLMVAKLNLDLDGPKLHCGFQRHRMSPIQDGLFGLLVQKVELDRIAVSIRVFFS